MEEYCASSPAYADGPLKRLYGMGLLPLVPGISIDALLGCIAQIKALPHLHGLIMGTRGIGKGLDDEALEPVWKAIADAGLVVFLHPHYGVDSGAWGEKDNGHVLPLALGFPFETTTVRTRLFFPAPSTNPHPQAITRFILAGVYDRVPDLRILLAHSGGTLPQLSSRLASCIDHDPVVAARLKHDARFYLGKLYFDAVCYGPEELGFVSEIVSRSERYAPGADNSSFVVANRKTGSGRMMFGTDHPFFPPLSSTEKWKSVVENLDAIDTVSGWDKEEKDGVRGGNALKIFGIL